MPDSTLGVLSFAADSLANRQQIIASNIANAQTPGFRASQVSFESSLQQALANGGAAQQTVSPSPLAPGTNGNNVSLAQQLGGMEQNTLQSQTVTDLLNSQLRILRGSMGGGFQ